MTRLHRFLAQYADWLAVLAGFAAVEYGLSCWSAPAAWVVGGVLVMVAAAWPPRKDAR